MSIDVRAGPMGEDDEPQQHQGVPSNYALSDRLARVEEQQQALSRKLDAMNEQLDRDLREINQETGRIERALNDDLSEIESDMQTVKKRNDHLWIIYTGLKWFIAVASGSSILAFVFTSLL